MQTFTVTLAVSGILLFMCIVRSAFSRRPIARTVMPLLLFDLVTLSANMVIMSRSTYDATVVAYLCYLAGTNWILFFLVRFSMEYCGYAFRRTVPELLVLVALVADTVSVALNPLLHHVFSLQETVMDDGLANLTLVSHAFHYPHLVLTYVLIALTLGVFTVKVATSSRLYLEKYLVVLLALLVVAVWESFYVFSRSPVDRSMLGFALCGILLTYFALDYKPFFVTDRMLATVVSNISDSILFMDTSGECIYFNESAAELFGVKKGDYANARRKLLEIISADDMHDCESLQVIKNRIKGGHEQKYELEYQKLYDKRQVLAGAFVSIKDRTREEEQKKREQYLATHDGLTGLLNREYLIHKIEQCLAADHESPYVIVCADIKEFKLVNDIFGKDAGDEVLKDIAKSLSGAAGGGSLCGRVGGDMFALFVRQDRFDKDALLAASGGITCTEGDVVYPITVHFGVYDVQGRDVPVSVMIDRACMAIDAIKGNMQNRLAVYDDQMRAHLVWSQQVTASLDEAIEKRQFVPYLQAQVDHNGTVAGAEVLVRWNHPAEGLLPPSRFVGILEKNGGIVRLDRYMWEAACRILRDWKAQGRSLYLSVNISPKDFYFMDVFAEIQSLTRQYGIDPSLLRLEITEGVMMSDVERKMQIIDQFRGAGYIVEMDDFGSGYSSLNLLKNLQFDILKLDMIFLHQSKDARRAETILESVIHMAQSLKMTVITEGVETEEQVRFLEGAGCDIFQGYYFSRPVPLAEFEERFA